MRTRTDRRLWIAAASGGVLLVAGVGWTTGQHSGPADEAGTTVLITRAVDGDTVKQDGDRSVRVLGINAPEKGTCWASEATARDADLVTGETVTLRSDPKQGDTDSYGRLLRYVELPDGSDLGAILVAEGDAVVYTRYPVAKTPDYLALQAKAQHDRRGLWGACPR